MAYSSAEINRISGSRLAVKDRKYIEENGNIWIGTKDNRLSRQYIKDNNIGVELDPLNPITSLKKFLTNLQYPLLSNFQTEIDFGEALYINQKEFIIINDKVKSNSIILASIAYDTPTGKELDELEMDVIEVKAGNPTEGSFKLLVTGTEGSLRNKFKINYTV